MQTTPMAAQDEQQSALEQFGINLTDRARQGKLDPVIGRDAEIRRISQVLTRRTKNNPVLIGEPGVGKTAVVEGLAQRIVAGDVAESLRGKELIALDISALVAGAMYRGQFEDRLKKVLKEITDSEGQIITFIDELHVLMGAGGFTPASAAAARGCSIWTESVPIAEAAASDATRASSNNATTRASTTSDVS